MDPHGFDSTEDFLEFVKVMSAHLEDLGFIEAHQDLSRLFNSAWTTSSELLGEIGLACEKILNRDGGRLPQCIVSDLKRSRTAYKGAFK
jgi:hypothetical protein